MLLCRHPLWMLRANIDKLTTLPHKLLADVRLATATGDRFVAKGHALVDVEPLRHRHEEPFTLTNEGLGCVDILKDCFEGLQFLLQSVAAGSSRLG